MTTAIILIIVSICGSATVLIWAICKSASLADRNRRMPPQCEWPTWRDN